MLQKTAATMRQPSRVVPTEAKTITVVMVDVTGTMLEGTLVDDNECISIGSTLLTADSDVVISCSVLSI